MKTHQQIDERSLAMARTIVAKIDSDPQNAGLEKARATCRRWFERNPEPASREWLKILENPWDQVRETLIEESEEGKRLRQSSPFCGILTPKERWAIYREFDEKD